MTLTTLKEKIDELYESVENADDVEVKVAIQPSYPLRCELRNVCLQEHTDDSNSVWFAIGNGEDYDVPNRVWNDSIVYDEDEEDEEN